MIRFKADSSIDDCKQISRILPYIGKESSGNVAEDARVVSTAIAELVESLGHKTTLTEVSSSYFSVHFTENPGSSLDSNTR